MITTRVPMLTPMLRVLLFDRAAAERGCAAARYAGLLSTALKGLRVLQALYFEQRWRGYGRARTSFDTASTDEREPS